MTSSKRNIIVFSLIATVICAALILKSYFVFVEAQKYQTQLLTQISGATHIKVVPNYDEDISVNQAFEEQDKKIVSSLIQSIKFSSSCKGFCACIGDVTIEFYHLDKLLASLSFHHGESLRWKNWPSDMKLTDESAEYIIDWLAKNGVTDIK